MRKLKEIISNIKIIKTVGDTNTTVEGITDNSKLVKRNYLFFAVKGISLDGHRYIDSAIENGSKVIICTHLPIKINLNICYVVVENIRESRNDGKNWPL